MIGEWGDECAETISGYVGNRISCRQPAGHPGRHSDGRGTTWTVTSTPTPDGYTPTTEQVRGAWGQRYGPMSLTQGHAEFDRWLAQHDAEVREGVVTFEATSAAALDGGIRAIADECGLLPESVVEMVLTALNVRVVR